MEGLIFQHKEALREEMNNKIDKEINSLENSLSARITEVKADVKDIKVHIQENSIQVNDKLDSLIELSYKNTVPIAKLQIELDSLKILFDKETVYLSEKVDRLELDLREHESRVNDLEKSFLSLFKPKSKLFIVLAIFLLFINFASIKKQTKDWTSSKIL